ncbi:MAG: hypothetical protein RSA53_11010 [Odoribacter sp.]
MRKKLLFYTGIGVFVVIVFVYFITSSWWWVGIIEIVFLFFLLLFFLFFLFLNFCVKKTNWYKNYFQYIGQFVSNDAYRDDLIRNYEIVNLGSNPARFAFMYNHILGQNWSTGTQSLNYDFRLLKYYHSYLINGGVVLIPLVVFSSCYTDNLNDEVNYHIKFNRILPASLKFKNNIRERLGLRFPISSAPIEALKVLLKDKPIDLSLLTECQPMDKKALMMDAENWLKGWKKEFNITDLEAPLTADNMARRCENINILREMIDFCLERGMKPVLVIPPMTHYLSMKFSESFRQNYIYSFVNESNIQNVPFLDYMSDERFSDPEFYFNSFFLNRKGRELFTKQVLKDLKLI